MDWSNVSRNDILLAYTKAVENAAALERDSRGCLQLCGVEVPSVSDFRATQFKRGWLWFKASFFNVFTEETTIFLLPGCETGEVRPPDGADILERVKYPEIVHDGGNVFWPTFDNPEMIGMLEEAVSLLDSRISRLRNLQAEYSNQR